MRKLVKKSIQVLDSYDEELGKMEHGQQQEAVNAALTMFFLAPINVKRHHVRLFREIRDGQWEIKPRESGHGAMLIGEDYEAAQWWKTQTDKWYPGPAAYFDQGSIIELPDDLRAERVPEHLLTKKQRERLAEKGSNATKAVEEVAFRKPKPRRRRKAGEGR